MRHTTEELVFAAEVRNLAAALRANEHTLFYEQERFKQDPGRLLTGDDFTAHLDSNQALLADWSVHWYAEHLVLEYTEQALDLIAQVADRIADLTTKR